MGFKDLMGDTAYYPGHAGAKEPTTSREAAEAVDGRARTLQAKVLGVLTERPRTADEVAVILGESVLAIRPRLSELRTLGKIEPTGDRRKNASGASAHVWRTKAWRLISG